MGKKGRKTRWRTLTIAGDEHSDSEESNTTTSGHRVPKGYPQKSYYSRFSYSSQSTPTRKYQCDGTKSTRSSSTASENKITFNEDEYTRITTPRQDVLFKKGYLNKPKTYQTQTSTGNSTTSTGNSTGNGTPDHQSTDLEYESQFVFPNGFVDQNGIYYVNSFEPYPVMVYNPPTYYPEYASVKTKRCSTGSSTESTSPHNEETSQDLSQSETPNNVSVSDLQQIYNVIYPGFYYNDACQPQADAATDLEPRRVKKKRRRKLSRSKSLTQEGTTATTTESSDEISSDEEAEQTKCESPMNESKECEEKSSSEGEEENEPEQTSKEEDTEDDAAQKIENETTKKYDLKPDAEEFVPRAYRQSEAIPMEANVQFIKIPSNFVPVPILNPMGEFNAAFIPHGIPINFIPQNYVNFVPYKTPDVQVEEEKKENVEEEEEKEEETVKETVEVPKKNNNRIDIAKIVSKLEEAAKEQDVNETINVKQENKNSTNKKRPRYQKVELRKPLSPSPEPKEWKKKLNSSPKKEENVTRPLRNYSETLKKSVSTTQHCERHERNMEKTKNRKEAMVKNHQKLVAKTPPKVSDEWISVSSRKKRKNKNVEETEDFEDNDDNEKEKDEVKEEEIKEEKREEKIETDVVESLPPPIEIKTEEIKEEKKIKKKPKKKTIPPPPPIKRVIIKDIDLSSEQVVEAEATNIVEEVEAVVVQKEEEGEIEKKESPEKKAKKKKKKVTKSTIVNGQSSSNTSMNTNDDSYDFLLDESLEKTNVEVSQELDKLIQRGMYSSLEEKIKSMNMESAQDSFFKTIISNISSRESSVEKNHPYMKSPDLSKLLTSSANLLKPILSTNLKSTKPDDDFLAESATPELHDGGGDTSPNDNLYPITKAVKEWMTKTRETTPDVEILKSPSTILREFGNDEEEVTIYSCWEEVRKTSTSSVEEGEDVLETYEKNDKFFRADAEDIKGDYPKHANLPYRAICCSIM